MPCMWRRLESPLQGVPSAAPRVLVEREPDAYHNVRERSPGSGPPHQGAFVEPRRSRGRQRTGASREPLRESVQEFSE